MWHLKLYQHNVIVQETCFLHVTMSWEAKETISSTFFQYDE